MSKGIEQIIITLVDVIIIGYLTWKTWRNDLKDDHRDPDTIPAVIVFIGLISVPIVFISYLLYVHLLN